MFSIPCGSPTVHCLISSSPSADAMPLTRARIEDTPVIDFVNRVMMEHSGAQLSETAAFTTDGGIPAGDVGTRLLSRGVGRAGRAQLNRRRPARAEMGGVRAQRWGLPGL